MTEKEKSNTIQVITSAFLGLEKQLGKLPKRMIVQIAENWETVKEIACENEEIE